MPGKTPHNSGNEPVENDVRKSQDVKGKGKKGSKDGDDEMTVVIPPSKNANKNQGKPPADGDGDVAMGDEQTVEGGEVKLDPVVQAVTGEFPLPEFSAKPAGVEWARVLDIL